jgi:acetolactate synthase small subunit
MTKDFTLDVFSDNGFNILNRMINICNRRRVRIKSLNAFEFEEDPRKGAACFVLHTTYEMAYKVQQQIEKLIEVEKTNLEEAKDTFYKVEKTVYDQKKMIRSL